VLHTWNQQLPFHPHIHCVVPAGGLAADHTRWIAGRHNFFLSVKVLGRVLRGKFVARLRKLHAAGKLGFHGGLAPFQAPQAFAAMLRPLFRSDWVVYSKRPFGGAEHALRYLGGYTHRVAISNHPLRANIDETVLPVVITEQGENRNQCEEQRNLFGFSHGVARRARTARPAPAGP
jgi:hypothetical protein